MSAQLVAHLINSAHQANARGNYGDAAAWCRQALQLAPNIPEGWYNLGIAARGLRQNSVALEALCKAAALTLDSPDAQNNIGLELFELKAYPESQQCFDRALMMAPEDIGAQMNLGKLLERLKKFEEAEALCRKVIAQQPAFALSYSNLASVLNASRRFGDAETECMHALRLAPNLPEAWSNLGTILLGLKRYSEAEAACRKALAINPGLAKAWSNLGATLLVLKNSEAEKACRQALSLEATLPEAWANLGAVLTEAKQYPQAEAAWNKALELAPDFAEAWRGLGAVHWYSKRYDQTIACYEKALALNPDIEFLRGYLLETRMKVCDWPAATAALQDLIVRVERKEKVTPPFAIVGVSDSLSLQAMATKIWADTEYPESNTLGPILKRAKKDKVRLGYYSADFHAHATTYLITELFESHDRNAFEVIAFSFGPDKNDAMRQRVAAACDQFIDVRDRTDESVAELSRQLEIDIAIDLKGFTEDRRTGIFAHRAAPIQLSYLGYPGTMAASYIDYLIADPILVPAASQSFYSEKIIYMPHSYQVNDSHRKIAETSFTRAELGLPESAFVFCCFNSNYKITPDVFSLWMRLLKQTDDSVLWLYEENPLAADRLRQHAQALGVSEARLVFAKPMPLAEHLARHRVADLFLDTWPCNAHTTASDSLWAGLPVLTCMGEAFASRVAASLVHAVGLPELLASSPEEYEKQALMLARDGEKLKEIRQTLERNRLTSPLFNAREFTKYLESAYGEIYARYQAGLTPDHIYVQATA